MVDDPRGTDPRVRKDASIPIVIGLLGIGLVCAAVALAITDPPDVRGLGSNASMMAYAETVLLVLFEVFLVGMAVVLLSGFVRISTTKVTEKGVSQLRPLVFRRVFIPFDEVTALREKGGCLWVESSREAIMVASPASHKDPEGFVTFLQGHVPPGTRYIPEN